MTREEAWELLTEYNQDEFHLLHAQTVENTMRYFARELGFADEEDFWGIVGLLHDLDFEKYPEEHCIKSQEIMKERGIDEKIIHATASHGYAITVDIKPEHEMEKVLYAVDELTGLIGAVVFIRFFVDFKRRYGIYGRINLKSHTVYVGNNVRKLL